MFQYLRPALENLQMEGQAAALPQRRVSSRRGKQKARRRRKWPKPQAGPDGGSVRKKHVPSSSERRGTRGGGWPWLRTLWSRRTDQRFCAVVGGDAPLTEDGPAFPGTTSSSCKRKVTPSLLSLLPPDAPPTQAASPGSP